MEDARIEASKALDLARSKLAQGDAAGAIRFAQKSIKIHATKAARSLLEDAEQQQQHAKPATSASTQKSASSSSPPPPPPPSSSTSKAKPTAEKAGPSRPYTPAQVTMVRELMVHVKKKDFYAILGLEKDAREAIEEDVLKKAYRKKALHFHPDKNAAPGADECFKAIGHAFQVLGDPQKKVIYDQEGAEAVNGNQARPTNPFAHFSSANMNAGPSFASQEINPEDLFNMLFGGAFGGGGVGRSPFSVHQGFGPFGYTSAFGQSRSPFGGTARQRYSRAGASATGDHVSDGASKWLALAPIIIYVVILFFSNILSSFFDTTADPRTSSWDTENSYPGSDIFTLHRSVYHWSPRQTETLGTKQTLHYFVNPRYEAQFLQADVIEDWNPIDAADRQDIMHPVALRQHREQAKMAAKQKKKRKRWTRPTILKLWVNNRYFYELKKQCRDEQRQLQADLRQANWFFGTSEGNAKRREHVLQKPRPACDEIRRIDDTIAEN